MLTLNWWLILTSHAASDANGLPLAVFESALLRNAFQMENVKCFFLMKFISFFSPATAIKVKIDVFREWLMFRWRKQFRADGPRAGRVGETELKWNEAVLICSPDAANEQFHHEVILLLLIVWTCSIRRRLYAISLKNMQFSEVDDNSFEMQNDISPSLRSDTENRFVRWQQANRILEKPFETFWLSSLIRAYHPKLLNLPSSFVRFLHYFP